MQNNRSLKIALLFLFIALGFIIFLSAVLKTVIFEDKHMPKLLIEEKNRAIRGSIISADGYQVAYSNKLYQVSVNTKYIDPQKKELFINLFSIYSGIPKNKVKEKVQGVNGNVVLSYKIDAKRAYQIKILAKKLAQLKVFIPITKNKNHIEGLTVEESGEQRRYPYKDTLMPLIGFIKKSEGRKYVVPVPKKGLELYYNSILRPKRDGVIKGERDIAFNIILNKDAVIKKRIDGYNLHLNINLFLQKNIENILDKHKKNLDAQEIIAAVMDSSTGKILAMASSNRYNPKKILPNEVAYLNPKFTEYPFEPGSVMKPITFAILLENGLVSPLELVRGYNGRFKLGRKIITDEHKKDWLSAENVIVYSSNIGIAQLAQRLKNYKFLNGLKMFDFGQKSGIDLPYEKSGRLLAMEKLKSKIYKATTAYGYGIKVTFIQLLKAYNVFNNDGIMQVPKIAAFYTLSNGKRRDIKFPKPKRVLSSKSAATMKDILIKVVEKGTGKVAKMDGLEIGGKTGTAHIVQNGSYVRKYHSSFFGFVNDKKHRYTIGVTVIKPKTYHFASQTAVPVFREIVTELLDEGYLNIDN